MSLNEYKVGILSGAVGTEREGQIAMQQSFGRVTDEIARSFSKCYLSLPIGPDDGTKEYVLQSGNIALIPQPYYKNTFQGVKYALNIIKAGKKLLDSSDVLFVRGTMPYLPFIYLYGNYKGKPIVQWMSADLLTML
ncbi:MAG: hypothetical protein JSW23_03700 [Planctomycetota bacterium]|nr:MAG: hypothetical protein JSW23_03700 [Planctomycetota bacterium]